MFLRARPCAWRRCATAAAGALFVCSTTAQEAAPQGQAQPRYEYQETRDLVALVDEAAQRIEKDGEAAFAQLRAPDGRFRHGETYVFVLALDGKMVVHPDPSMEGRNQIDLKDIDGRPIVRGLLGAATTLRRKPAGFYHYEWPVPGGILPRWKSSYVRLATAPSGMPYVVGSGMYNDRMERAFVVDMVQDAVGRIEKEGETAFVQLRDPTGPFRAKDAYVFVIDPNGVDVVNPAFPNLEGRNILDVKDTQGKQLVREFLEVAKTSGSGWVDYMWPRPGDSVSTQKSTFVAKANVGGKWLLVGSGVYLADAKKAPPLAGKATAPEFMALVQKAAALLEQRGEKAYPELRTKGSPWLHDDTYFFVWSLDGRREFHAVDPTLEGKDASTAKDVLGRPYGAMIRDVARSREGQGWVHYMYPEPGDIFPVWKSVFVKRVRFPSGEEHLVGAGIYNLQMDKAFIEDVVARASALVADRGPAAFALLRDKTGPFRFMDTYVFVYTRDGVEVVNPIHPSLEGVNLMGLKDVHGKAVTADAIAAAMKDGTAWIEYWWYQPGHDTPVRKLAYVRRVQAGEDTYIVGSGFYLEK